MLANVGYDIRQEQNADGASKMFYKFKGKAPSIKQERKPGLGTRQQVIWVRETNELILLFARNIRRAFVHCIC